MEKLIASQMAQKELLEKFIINYKKDGKDRRTRAYYAKRLENLQLLWEGFEAGHKALLLQKFSDSEFDECKFEYLKTDVYSKMEELYYTIYAAINERFEKEFPTENSSRGVSVSSEEKTFKSESPKAVKLPKIYLEKFNGDYRKWSSFHDLFKTLIHENSSLSPCQKLQYLKMHVSGEPEQLLRHFQITDGNYQSAWEMLNDRYNNKRVMVNAYLKPLLSQPVLSNESAQNIKGLLDTTSECLLALDNLQIQVSNWDPLIVYVVVQRLPAETHQLWEQSVSKSKELPSWKELQEFLESRFRTLEAVSSKKSFGNKEHKSQFNQAKTNHKAYHVTSGTSCMVCLGNHSIRQCPSFLSCTTVKRMEIVKSKGLCINCLGSGHILANCPSQQTCWHCKKRHHSLLHRQTNEGSRPMQTSSTTAAKSFNLIPNYDNTTPNDITSKFLSIDSPAFIPEQNASTSTNISSFVISQSNTQQVLLATAMVRVVSSNGQEQVVRALIDPGSQASFLTESIVQDLSLKREKVSANIYGIGKGRINQTNYRVNFTIKPLRYDIKIEVSGLVLKKLTDFLPSKPFSYHKWKHLQNLELADPHFNQPGKIDLLLGADVYSHIIMDGIIKSINGSPVAQKTSLGWILSGEIDARKETNINVQNFYVQTDLEDQLKKFWEVEEIQEANVWTNEEKLCEERFVETTRRLPSGRYEVALPMKDESENYYLGKSRNIAISRLIQIETRFRRDPKLKEEYSNCLQEYLSLGHMQKICIPEEQHKRAFGNIEAYSCAYLPHHGVIKESSSTTKLRVVFDASRTTQSGTSLNEMMLKGPVIQEELASLFIKWRKHRIAFTADIEKMYRQILVREPHTEFQRIVWRKSPSENIEDYKLLTVTFGTKSAPFLATRVLKQLAMDEKERYPVGSEVLESDFYVDDLLSGSETIESALTTQKQLISILQSGGFQLRKWSSNCSKILETIPQESREKSLPHPLPSEQGIRTLGTHWNPHDDTLSFSIRLDQPPGNWTKRNILSAISKLFDPLGLVAPVIVIAKVIIQKLWLSGVGWDNEIPAALQNEWTKYYDSLKDIQNIKIPRWLHLTHADTALELHAFSDASQKAYAAAVYLCVTNTTGQRNSTLVAAKTRVAPLKTITLPRLELCAAALLTKLVQYVLNALKLSTPVSVYAWTDSEIVISWLRSHPSKWSTFVANRVSFIHEKLGRNVWSHVASKENPADLATRGILPLQLQVQKLWWNGPEWLCKPKDYWPKGSRHLNTDLEIRKTAVHHVYVELIDLDSKYSKLSTLLRVTAYCLRFIHNLRKQNCEKRSSYLKAKEIREALIFWLKRVQERHFSDEIKLLKSKKTISRRSSILKLNPFLDQNGILRVGGRLRHSQLSYDEKYPIILPSKSDLTALIIQKVHKETLHGGPQLMMNIISRKYWLLNARSVIRHHVHKCLSCFRQKAAARTQLMGDLPFPRVTMSRPFAHTGVDYSGPFEIKTHKGRNPKKYKAYIALFICMATKAIHLELVSDLTAEGFIAAFRRFCSRRGLCSEIYCDCGTNFVGANKIIQTQHQQLLNQLDFDIASLLENEGVKFNFIPPASPHFGGLWEAGVKSTKSHLKRVLGGSLMTFEEFNTILVQIEACLNSRPLCELSNDPRDANALTPAHFLIGDTLLTPPEPSVLDLKTNRLDRWQYIQRLTQTFWKRWSSEYLHRLQQRPKWACKTKNLNIGDLVLLKENNLPPSHWIMGRIIETHPGSDGLVRVVSLRIKDKIFKRPITKLCKLPLSSNEEN